MPSIDLTNKLISVDINKRDKSYEDSFQINLKNKKKYDMI